MSNTYTQYSCSNTLLHPSMAHRLRSNCPKASLVSSSFDTRTCRPALSDLRGLHVSFAMTAASGEQSPSTQLAPSHLFSMSRVCERCCYLYEIRSRPSRLKSQDTMLVHYATNRSATSTHYRAGPLVPSCRSGREMEDGNGVEAAPPTLRQRAKARENKK